MPTFVNVLPLLTSTAYFAPLSWYRAAAVRPAWYWQGGETYQKGGWRNRCRILTANGPLLLSVPLAGGKHQQMPIGEVAVSYHDDWPRRHEQTIRSAYGRAPYYEHFSELVLAPARRRPASLWQLNFEIATALAPLLGRDGPPGVLPDFRPPPHPGYDGPENISAPVPLYPQVFGDRYGFVDDLSVLDALFCLGPAALL